MSYFTGRKKKKYENIHFPKMFDSYHLVVVLSRIPIIVFYLFFNFTDLAVIVLSSKRPVNEMK